jgi:hypothetical protein
MTLKTEGATIHPTRAKQVTDFIGNKNLELVQGEGYWYFIYDNQRGKYETHSVQVLRLNHLSLVEWIAEGKDFVAQMEPKPVEFTTSAYLGLMEMEMDVAGDNVIVSVGNGELLKETQELMNTHMYRYRVEFAGKQLKHRIRTGMADDGLMLGITTIIEE